MAGRRGRDRACAARRTSARTSRASTGSWRSRRTPSGWSGTEVLSSRITRRLSLRTEGDHVHVNWSTRLYAAACTLAVALIAAPSNAQVVSCDFDVADDLGRHFWGSTAHVTGRQGAGSNRAEFILINGNSPDTDVDKDGYATACVYTDIYIE